jgi:hypothetical protein
MDNRLREQLRFVGRMVQPDAARCGSRSAVVMPIEADEHHRSTPLRLRNPDGPAQVLVN